MVSLAGLRSGFGGIGVGAEEALVWSNCVNMGLRVAFVGMWVNGRFGAKKGSGVRWRECVPRRAVWVAVGLAGCAVRISERWFVARGGIKALGVHVGVGAVCGVGCLGVM